MKYPETKEIIDFLYFDYGTRAAITGLQNKIMSLKEDFFGWCDDCWIWDLACDMKEAFENGKFFDVSSADIPKLMKEYEAENVFELVEWYFSQNKKILNILPAEGDEEEVDTAIIEHMTSTRKDLQETYDKLKAQWEEESSKAQTKED